MNQNDLIDAAKQQQGLTSDNQLALRLGITRMRMSDLKKGRRPVDEAEIFMLAEMAQIEPMAATALVRKETEKNPAKRAYWEKISMKFAVETVAAANVVAKKISGNFESLISRCAPRRSFLSAW